MAGIKFIEAYGKASGRKVLIPSHWLDIPSFAEKFRKTPTQRRDDGEIDLKGKALDDALDDAGLPKTGTADEKRAAIAEHLAENFSHTSPDVSDEPPANTATVESDITTTPNTPGAGDNEKE